MKYAPSLALKPSVLEAQAALNRMLNDALDWWDRAGGLLFPIYRPGLNFIHRWAQDEDQCCACLLAELLRDEL